MGKTILITGASGGIGAAIARRFAAGENRLVLGYHQNQRAAVAVQKELEPQGGQVLLVQGDIREEQQVERMVSQAEDVFGPVDVLVNNAGIEQQKLFCDISAAEWREMFDVHVTGSFLTCRRVLPSMIRKKCGCIVNVSSIWGQVGASCEVHYSAAKAAVIGMTQALAKEVGPSGVRVNCVAPGAVDTAMMAHFTPQEKQDFCEDVPLGRLARAEEVADSVHFLCSDRASYLTGQVLAPNGGMV